MSKSILLSAAILSGLAVIIGAFGAHALAGILEENNKVSTFDTASKYHFYHSLALLFIGYIMRRYRSNILKTSALLMLFGMIIFSGSLYALSLTNIGILGAIAPIGGILLVIGWTLLVIGLYRKL